MGLAGGELQYLLLTNRSISACSVYGLPTSAQATRQGRTFSIEVIAGTPLDQPEDPAPVILRPGRSAAIALASSHAEGHVRAIVYEALSFLIPSVGRLTWNGSFEPDHGFGIGPVTTT
jgi:hypothetical protein